MPTETTTPVSESYVHATQPIPYERVGFGWGAVLAGLAVAVALNVFLALQAFVWVAKCVEKAVPG